MNVDTPHPGRSGVGLVWHWQMSEHGSGIRVIPIDACALLKSGALAPHVTVALPDRWYSCGDERAFFD